MPIPLGVLAVAGAGAAGGGAAYELIQTVSLSSSQAAVTFSSIPQTYLHLQVRWVSMNTNTNEDHLRLTFNGNSSASYIDHTLYGNGDAVLSSSSGASQTSIRLLFSNAYNNSPQFSPGVMDILDYASTSKNTTIRSLQGYIWPTQRTMIALSSGAWFNTAAVTSLTLTAFSDSLASGSRFSLYGIK